MTRWVGILIALVASISPSLLSTRALADVVTLNHASIATGVDNGPEDGVFDSFTSLNLGSVNDNGYTSFRTAMQFDLSALPLNIAVNRAALSFSISNFEGTRPLVVRGYAGDGSIRLADFGVGTPVATTLITPAGTQSVELDVTSFVSDLVGARAPFAAFDVGEEPPNRSNYLVMFIEGALPRLTIDYAEVSAGTLSALGPANLWLGLTTSDDRNTAFDVKVKLRKNGVPGAAGLTRCVKGLDANPAKARRVTILFNAFDAVPVNPGDHLTFTVLTRIGTNVDGTRCSGPRAIHEGASGLRLYYDSDARDSGVAMTIAPDPSVELFLHSDGSACPRGDEPSSGVTTSSLDDSVPSARAAKCSDSAGVNFADGNAFQPVGTWTMTVPVTD